MLSAKALIVVLLVFFSAHLFSNTVQYKETIDDQTANIKCKMIVLERVP